MKKWLYDAYIIVCILCVVAILAYIFLPLFGIVSVASDNNITTAASLVLTLLATVIGASYLANVLNRKDIEEHKKEIEQIREFNNQYGEVSFLSFMKELEANRSDSIICDLIGKFRNVHESAKTDSTKKDDLDYAKLTEIEILASIAKARHISEYKSDDVLKDTCQKGIDLIKEATGLSARHEYGKYLKYREVLFWFYKGYCDTKADRITDFKTSAKKARQFQFDYDYDNSCAINNILGESYSKIVHYYSDDKSKGKVALSKERASKDAKSAIDKLKITTQNAEASDISALTKSVYYRNLGCAYERQTWIKNGKSNPDYNETSHKNIIECYESSIKHMLSARGSFSEGTVIDTYYVLLAYCKKYIEFHSAIYQSGSWRMNGIINDYETEIKLMYKYAELAYKDCPASFKIRHLYAFANIYMYYLVTDKKEQYAKKIDDICKVEMIEPDPYRQQIDRFCLQYTAQKEVTDV